MTDDRRNESRELAKPSLAQRDLAEGRWRGVNFYEMTAMRRYRPMPDLRPARRNQHAFRRRRHAGASAGRVGGVR
jgi:hypothetical protein